MIVVGFDGSMLSAAALRWAVGEAALRGVEVHGLTRQARLGLGVTTMPFREIKPSRLGDR
jgi:nucleotide-binding universal stress UspA family protein